MPACKPSDAWSSCRRTISVHLAVPTEVLIFGKACNAPLIFLKRWQASKNIYTFCEQLPEGCGILLLIVSDIVLQPSKFTIFWFMVWPSMTRTNTFTLTSCKELMTDSTSWLWISAEIQLIKKYPTGVHIKPNAPDWNDQSLESAEVWMIYTNRNPIHLNFNQAARYILHLIRRQYFAIKTSYIKVQRIIKYMWVSYIYFRGIFNSHISHFIIYKPIPCLSVSMRKLTLIF